MKFRNAIELIEDPEEARARQERLASELDLVPGPTRVRLVGATDVAYDKETDEAHAGVVVLDAQTLEVVAEATWSGAPGYPYVPGLFGLREASCLVPAFEALDVVPDVFLIDGHGFAHPRRFGLACLLGWALGVPTIGCAKKRLCGAFEQPADAAGSFSEMIEGGQVIGHALRTQPGTNPVFTSPGWGYDVETATALVMSVTGEYRIPEPLRQAHRLSIETRAGEVLR